MKKLIGMLICAATVSFAAPSFAQQKDNIGSSIKKTADTVAAKTKKTVKKGTAAVVDKTYSDKVGPDGQTIYIDKHSKYYYIDGKGNKAYVTKAEMKDKAK